MRKKVWRDYVEITASNYLLQSEAYLSQTYSCLWSETFLGSRVPSSVVLCICNPLWTTLKYVSPCHSRFSFHYALNWVNNVLMPCWRGFILCGTQFYPQLQIQEAGEEGMADAGSNITTPAVAATPAVGSQVGMEWQAATQRWVESSGKPPFRVVPDDSKPTLRDPVSISFNLSLSLLWFLPRLSWFS